MTTTLTEPAPLLTRKALSARWSRSDEWLRQIEKAGKIVPIRLGTRGVRYRLSDVEKFENGVAT